MITDTVDVQTKAYFLSCNKYGTIGVQLKTYLVSGNTNRHSRRSLRQSFLTMRRSMVYKKSEQKLTLSSMRFVSDGKNFSSHHTTIM